jgi:hypothetical protein
MVYRVGGSSAFGDSPPSWKSCVEESRSMYGISQKLTENKSENQDRPTSWTGVW